MSSVINRGAVLPIETVRAIAIIMLVSFHVIGGPDGQGLGLDRAHPLRLYGDLLIDLRMPFFAFVSGMIYAMRPVKPERVGQFLGGKFRRLAVPGIAAMSIFAFVAVTTGAASQPPMPIWIMYTSGYAIFWFLQAILLIFMTAAVLDILSRGKLLLPMLAASALALSLGWTFPSDFMSANQVTTLLPYFLLGAAIVRNKELVIEWKRVLLIACSIMMIAGLVMNVAVLFETGSFSAERLDIQSLLLGGGACIVAILILPNIEGLKWLGAYSLTIYLYHIFATSGFRKALFAFGIDSSALHLIVGTALGIALPVMLHFAASKWPPSRALILGLKPAARMQDPIRADMQASR